MNLNAKKREGSRKSLNKQIRRIGNIPGIFYAPGKTAQSIEIDGKGFEVALRKMKQGMLATQVFTLDIEGKKAKAIVKGIQYDLTKYQGVQGITHIDFQELQDDVPVRVKVPVHCTGLLECEGIKLGGYLRQVIRAIEVECLPKYIPEQFEVDVQPLGLHQSRRLSDLAMPKGVKPLAATNEVVVVIAKR